MKILTMKMRNCTLAPEQWFTGRVWMDEIVTPERPAHAKALRVSFEPGARTAWHSHPKGQALHVESGVGCVQLKGEPIREIRPGDTVWIEAGEIHWHGATPNHPMAHLAIQESDDSGSYVTWFDRVSDEEYRS